ncbi:MAG: NTP transferase domain-containing protein, partial [Actinomycetota bacterium]|nr:NTP transferase domain-containing protein [Actinomycetota bacterium]
MNENLAVVILAAGKGKRMESATPKVLHQVCGRPIINYVLEETLAIGAGEVVVIVGHGSCDVRKVLPDEVRAIEQHEQLGTGHAVRVALEELKRFSELLVLPGDSPLVKRDTLKRLIEERRRENAVASIIVTELEDPTGYGRLVRNISGGVARIVEDADATHEERKIKEVNACTYAFDSHALGPALDSLKIDNVQGEYYLTGVVEYMVERGGRVVPVKVPWGEVLGINDREQLALVENIMRRRINTALMGNGVTIKDPKSTFIDHGVEIERDTELMPFVFVRGKTRIGSGCRIGPCTLISDSTIGDGTKV